MMLTPDHDPITQLIDKLPYCPQEDRGLLKDLFQRFPKVLAGFKEFVELAPGQRIPMAARKLEHTPRSGWLRFDLPIEFREILITHATEYYGSRLLLLENALGAESILEHSAEAQELFVTVFLDYRFKQWGAEIMKFHDFVEAITGDFTPFDDISKAEKKFLEKIALQLLTESRNTGDLLALHICNCMEIYEGERIDFIEVKNEMLAAITNEQQAGRVKAPQVQFVKFLTQLYSVDGLDLTELKDKATDIDALQMLIAGRRIVKNKNYLLDEPKDQKEWDAFLAYISRKMLTQEAKLFNKIFCEYFFSADDHRQLLLNVLSAYDYNHYSKLEGSSTSV